MQLMLAILLIPVVIIGGASIYEVSRRQRQRKIARSDRSIRLNVQRPVGGKIAETESSSGGAAS